jgi:hypothetical protein
MLRSPLSSPLRRPMQSPLAARKGGEPPEPTGLWLLITGSWADLGQWDDADTWNDGV